MKGNNAIQWKEWNLKINKKSQLTHNNNNFQGCTRVKSHCGILVYKVHTEQKRQQKWDMGARKNLVTYKKIKNMEKYTKAEIKVNCVSASGRAANFSKPL